MIVLNWHNPTQLNPFFFPDRTIINFVQPQPNSIQNKNNPISCGTAPGNLVKYYWDRQTND